MYKYAEANRTWGTAELSWARKGPNEFGFPDAYLNVRLSYHFRVIEAGFRVSPWSFSLHLVFFSLNVSW